MMACEIRFVASCHNDVKPCGCFYKTGERDDLTSRIVVRFGYSESYQQSVSQRHQQVINFIVTYLVHQLLSPAQPSDLNEKLARGFLSTLQRSLTS